MCYAYQLKILEDAAMQIIHTSLKREQQREEPLRYCIKKEEL
jgi:hypothetical protein